MFKEFIKGWVCLSLFCLTAMNAIASSTTTTTFAVSANIPVSCTVSAVPLTFGNYTGLVLPVTTTVSATCTNGHAYNIGLDAGIGSGATVAIRKMTGGGASSSTLNYSLYQDSGHTTVWGNTPGTNTVSSTGTGVQQNFTVYGQIPAGQTSVAGNYVDTITVTVNF